MHVRALVRRLVLATSFSPFLQIYRGAYAAVTRLVVRRLRRHPEIQAVYLRRGGSKGEILPLVSDLDFAIIGRPLSDDDARELQTAYRRLARWTSFLDGSLEAFDERRLAEQFRASHHFRFRFTEGRHTWRLVHGRDYIRELPELALEELRGGIFAEMQIWWMLFVWRLLHGRRYHDERVTRNNMCYKAVAETARVSLALRAETLVYGRDEALRRALSELPDADRRLASDLQASAARGFRPDVAHVVERTQAFLLDQLEGLTAEFESRERERAASGVRVRVECDPREWAWGRPARAHVDRLLDHVRSAWDGRVLGASAVASLAFNLDEILLVLRVDPERRPSARQVAELYRLHRGDGSPAAGGKNGPGAGRKQALRRAPAAAEARVHVFLLSSRAAFQLDGEDLQKSWQTLLCGAANPETFELLGRRELVLRGSAPPVDVALWTPLAEHFLTEELRLFLELLDDPTLYKVDGFELLRVFWKTAQLAVAAESLGRGEAFHALTLPAVRRGLEALGRPIRDRLAPLEEAYLEALEGKAVDLGELAPPAIEYLKELTADVSGRRGEGVPRS